MTMKAFSYFQSRVIPAFTIAFALALAIHTTPTFAQFDDSADAKSNGVKLDQSQKQRVRIGMEVTAVGGPCKGIFATLPVPTEWPEQQVKLVDEKQTAGVSKITYRNLGAGAKQMIITVPNLASGNTASAFATFEVTRHSLLPPTDHSKLHIPKKVPSNMNLYLSESPFIESRNPKIVALAKEIPTTDSDWAKIEAIYDLIRTKMEYKEGAIKGAVKGLAEGKGDCEDLSSLFIAVCRQQKIPARTVWVEGHCYPEFYMEDDDKKGYWMPCQAAGQRAFGGISEFRPILQKGDSFHDPDRSKERLRYVSEFMKGVAIKGGGEPKHKFVREILPE